MHGGGIARAPVFTMMPYLKLRDNQDGQSELSTAGGANTKQKVPQPEKQKIKSDIEEESLGYVAVMLVRYRVRSKIANIDVFRQTLGQANQVAALLNNVGIQDVKIEETLG